MKVTRWYGGGLWFRLIIPIQGAFGWENSHLFQFSESGFSDKTVYGIPGDDIDPEMITFDAKKTKMNKVLRKEGQRGKTRKPPTGILAV
jgi:hypothetical protein